jgi:hypothetical protein
MAAYFGYCCPFRASFICSLALKNMKKKEENKAFYKNSWIFIPLIIICAVLAGIFGEILTKSYFLKDGYFSSYANEINLSSLNTGNTGLIIRDAKKVVVNQDVKIAETISGTRSVLFGIFNKEAVADSYYNLENPDFTAFVVTSDGWLLMPINPNEKNNFKAADYVAIDSSRKIYEIDSISESEEDNLLFIHLTGAQNLSIRKNAAKSDFSLGQELILISSFNSAKSATLISIAASSNPMSSELPSLDLRLDVNGEDIENSFVFNLAGDLAAIVDSNGKVVPAYSYNYYWRRFLEKNNLGRAYLGVNYLDLSLVKMASSSTDYNKGSLLFSAKNKAAVLKSSPAEIAGLKEGDIITWVNNQEISRFNGLAEIISFYLPGDKITLTFLRDAKEQEVNIVLGEIK